MVVKILRFACLLFVSLTLGLSFAHVMGSSGKMRLDGPVWLFVQQDLYIAFGVIGAAIEGAAVLLTWMLVIGLRRNRLAFGWTLVAALAISASLVVWFMLVAPVNVALNGWTPNALPADWTVYRSQWEFGQATHFVLIAFGFSGLAIGLLNETGHKLFA
jgi:hypothetical protein